MLNGTVSVFLQRKRTNETNFHIKVHRMTVVKIIIVSDEVIAIHLYSAKP